MAFVAGWLQIQANSEGDRGGAATARARRTAKVIVVGQLQPGPGEQRR